MATLYAGAAAVEITPETPQWLDGFGNRTAPSEGCYLPIWAKALRLDSGETSVMLVSAEVLGFDRARVPALKERIAAAVGVSADAVILAATHTHCAPRVCDMVMPGEVDSEYLVWFEAQCVRAAQEASAAVQPARLFFSRTQDDFLGVNRRYPTEQGAVMRPNPGGSHDRDVDTLWVEAEAGGALLASLTLAACHPTSRGGQQVGGDYPGYLCRELERVCGGVALFVLGCAGDVRPAFTDAEGRFRPAELEEVARAGQQLAEKVVAAGTGRKELSGDRLEVRRGLTEAPLNPVPEAGELRRIAEEDPAPLRRRWAEDLLRRDGGVPRSLEFEIQVLALPPDMAIIFWPGEVVADYALWVKQIGSVPGDPLILAAAYSNGAVGYVPSRAIYPLGGYEVHGSHPYYRLPASYAPEVEDRLKDATLELLKVK